jgi:ferredoxin
MTIKRDKDELCATCDECGEECYSGAAYDPSSQEDFRSFVKDLRDEGWSVNKEDDEWTHRCSTCSEE